MVKKKEGVGEKLDYLIDYVTGKGLRVDLARDFVHVFATKEDLRELATKNDLFDVEGRIKSEIQSIRVDLDEVKKRLSEVEKKLGRFWKALDEDLKAERGEIEKLELRVSFLEKRLKKVEAVRI